LLRQRNRRLEGGELPQALVVLGMRVGVGDDPGPGLEVRDAVVEDDRPDRDAGVQVAVGEGG